MIKFYPFAQSYSYKEINPQKAKDTGTDDNFFTDFFADKPDSFKSNRCNKCGCSPCTCGISGTNAGQNNIARCSKCGGSPCTCGSNPCTTGGNPDSGGGLNTGGQAINEIAFKQSIDAETNRVKIHEQAHYSTAGDLAESGPVVKFKSITANVIDPNTGKACNKSFQASDGGFVKIKMVAPGSKDMSMTMLMGIKEKAQRGRRAALAPMDPSGTDLKFAAQASATEAKTQNAIDQQKSQGNNPDSKTKATQPGLKNPHKPQIESYNPFRKPQPIQTGQPNGSAPSA